LASTDDKQTFIGLILLGAFSDPIELDRGSSFCFYAFSSREPASTSLENALQLACATDPYVLGPRHEGAAAAVLT
jgi:hypothetical protein